MDLHDWAINEFDKIQTAVRNERLQCLEDRRFASIAGAQWEGPLQSQFENKPKIEINKVQPAITRIISEYRNNRIDVAFVSKDGTEYDKLADTCADLHRADVVDSCADEARDNAFEEAVTGGFGAYRLRNDYEFPEDADDQRQRIRIEPIYDADSSVFFDLNAKRQDKSDARYAFVVTAMSPEAYEEEYGQAPSPVDKQIQTTFFDWQTPDVVYVAEVYKVEEKKEKRVFFENLDGESRSVKAEELESEGAKLAALGFVQTGEKTITAKRVRKFIISGNAILEDCGYIAGKCIPIIPVYGKRWFVDNVERCSGHVRLAKDAQRLKNMQMSKLAEISAISSVEKPILLAEQVQGHEVRWSEDNIKNYPYLLINPILDQSGQIVASQPVSYTRSPNIPPALGALLAVTDVDMKDLLGNQGAADQLVSNISGKAVEMIQSRVDMQTAIYVQNFSKAVKREGEVWLSMASDIYTEPGRKMKMVDGHGKAQPVTLNKPVMDENGEVEFENDLTEAKFDVSVEVGPTSDSRRQATVRAITGMMAITQNPEDLQVLSAMALFNMEGEGISDVQDYYRRKLVRLGILKPTEEEAQAMAQQAGAQDPQAILATSMAEQAQADAAKARAEVVKVIAQSEETKARTAKLEAETMQVMRMP